MPKLLVAALHHGMYNQTCAAIHSLTPAQKKELYKEFSPGEVDKFLEDRYTPDLDPELESWLADWIEQNTNMYWEDGELWRKL